MGYYVTGGGTISFAAPVDEKTKKRLDEILCYWFESVYWAANDLEVDVYYDGTYHTEFEDDIQKLNSIAKIDDGSIIFHGEDDAHWRFDFVPGSGWNEVNGYLYFEDELPATKIPDDEKAEFLGQILDCFEDFLEAKGIDIPNPEKEDDDFAAILYGTDYGELSNAVEEVLINWKILKQ